MSRILFLYEYETPTSSGTREFYGRLAEKGLLESVCVKKISKVNRCDIDQADIIVLLRATGFLSVGIARKASKSGKYVIAYYDDDLMNRPDDRPVISWRRTNVKRVLKYSNLIHSSSRVICERYRRYTIENRGVQTDTAVHGNELRSRPKTDSDIIRIVYAANAGHACWFEKYIAPALEKLDEHNKKIKFSFIGVRPVIANVDRFKNIEVEFVEGMPFSEYRKYMDAHDYDIGLAPLENNEFTKCKYINKFIEYAIFQIPGVFSRTEPYTDVIIDGENGFLSDNDPKEWKKTLTRIIEDEAGYKAAGYRAIEMIREKFSFDGITEKLFRDIPELKSYKSTGNKFGLLVAEKVYDRLMCGIEVVYLAFSYLRIRGVRGMFNKAFSHVRGMKNYENNTK